MAVKIGSARIDENGHARGGNAGDQTGKEVSTQNWYKHSKGWVVIRPKDAFEAERIAQAIEAACKNSNIGYDQGNRLSLWNKAKPKGFNPALVTENCETDCSALVRVCCAYAGIMAENFRTTNEVKVLKATGAFDILTDKKYTDSQDYLKRGDILCTKTQGHTVVVLTNGSMAGADAGGRILRRGCAGDDVQQLQKALLALGYVLPGYGADGDFGAETEAAVKAFQRDHGLDADGEYGPKSAAALENAGEAPKRIVIPDVSANQGKIDFDRFCAGCAYAIFRARVSGNEDKKFREWAAEMNKRNFAFGVYDFVKLKSEADAIRQAEAMFKLCDPFKPTVYYLDTEKLADGMTYAKERPCIKAYVKRLRELGVKVIGQYTGDYRWRSQYYRLEDIFDTLWIANWGKNNGKTGGTLKSKSDKIHLQQYTSYGYTRGPGAPGIDHRVDMNQLTGRVPLSWFTGRRYE